MRRRGSICVQLFPSACQSTFMLRRPFLPLYACSVGGVLHVRLEVVAPPEVSSFPFKGSDVKRVMDLQASDFVFSCVHRSHQWVGGRRKYCVHSLSFCSPTITLYVRRPTPRTHCGNSNLSSKQDERHVRAELKTNRTCRLCWLMLASLIISGLCLLLSNHFPS